jgi:hypothetical protein
VACEYGSLEPAGLTLNHASRLPYRQQHRRKSGAGPGTDLSMQVTLVSVLKMTPSGRWNGLTLTSSRCP